MRVGILYSRVRAEEKLLFEEFRLRGAEFDLLDARKLSFHITRGSALTGMAAIPRPANGSVGKSL